MFNDHLFHEQLKAGRLWDRVVRERPASLPDEQVGMLSQFVRYFDRTGAAVAGRTGLLLTSIAAACLLAAALTRPAAAADPQPAAVTVTGDASSGIEYEETWTDGLTVKPWYFFGQPVLAVVTGKVSFYTYKTRTEVGCLFGLAWDIKISDSSSRSVSFKCMWVGSSWVGNYQSGPYPAGGIVATFAAGDGLQPGGYLFLTWWQGWDPRPELRADVHVAF